MVDYLFLSCDVFSLFSLGVSPCLTWIGHLYVYWAAIKAGRPKNGRQLGFPREIMQVCWLGERGMTWDRVVRRIGEQLGLGHVSTSSR
ncbi:hypothetical protein XENTR_v10000226 [Xenopus tropicalis]|nr:hypothetical protein XENTR_v10000226 [Xenopus tropicalis]